MDLLTPRKGLNELYWREQSLADWQILGVEFESLDSQTTTALVDGYQRGGDLVATYASTPTRPFRVQIYWRATLSHLDSNELPIVDLQLSVQTDQLDGRPALTTAGRLPKCETLDIVDTLGRDNPPRGRLFRPAGFDFSYAELIHPADFRGAELKSLSDGVQFLVARLFGGELEKGVILRARVRGVFLPRRGDLALAALVFADFARQPPPLTT